MESLDVLRPDDERPAVQLALRAWLAFQEHFVFRPADGRAALIREPDPRRVLAAAGAPELADERRVAALRACAAQLVPFGSSLYPARLARLADAPPVLLVRGCCEALATPGVAIVGARAPSVYGREQARRFGSALAAAGVGVVSGLAIGVDGAAHAGALDRDGVGVAVLGCGPDRIYPARHRGLAERLLRRGAVVSEFAPGTPPRAAHFPLRNRIISALGVAVLVVEARLRSGSLVTARLAADQGVDVWALPGPVDAPTSEGPNRLLADGAAPALSPGTLLASLVHSGALARAVAVETQATTPAARRHSGLAGRLLALLDREPSSRDALCRRLGLTPAELAEPLLELELAGRVCRDRDGRYRCVSPAPDSGLS